jgi:hypothetical protein
MGRQMRRIIQAGNTLVLAILLLEQLGFTLAITESSCRATRGDEAYGANDPETVLGLVKLVEVRSWKWHPTDDEIEATIRRYPKL